METLTDPRLAKDLLVDLPSPSPAKDRIILAGYALLLTSAGLFALEDFLGISRKDDNFSIFFIHYFIALAYVVVLIVNKSYGIRKSWWKVNIHKTAVLLNLFLVSAYALNRVIAVFEESVSWLCVLLVLTSGVLMTYHYFPRLPKAVNAIQHLLLGGALVLYLYLAVYVANFYIFGSIGIIAFGIGAHIFIPLLLFGLSIRLVMIAQEIRKISVAWVAVGATVPMMLFVAFAFIWQSRIADIDRLANQSVLQADTGLPVWVKVAQTVENDWITERILKSRFVYTVSNDHFQWDLMPRGANWDEKRLHDPLVFLATAVRSNGLSVEDSKSVLLAIADNRHRAQERLWSGDNLSTSYIVSDIDLYPQLRMAYTEHYFNVRNNRHDNRVWRNSQEAIYTFQLPEGSVVTSLSLWVNGKEEKAILTSKQKANQAYSTIVGREMRDPSVVHWQEGNTISVRVFPCTPDEERKFKIGITSPLAVVGDQVVYKNVTFKGPDAGNATQASRVSVIGTGQDLSVPKNFSKNVKGEYEYEGSYDPNFTITMKASPITEKHFSFDGITYSLVEAQPAMRNIKFTNIYADINNSWSSSEIDALRPLLDKYQIHAYVTGDFILLNETNWEEIVAQLQETNFSLFPFHHVSNTANSIVVTKGKEFSPHLADIKTSAFAKGIADYFSKSSKVYVFNLEGSTSTYIKSLNEFRAFNFADGNVAEFTDMLTKNKFPAVDESENRIVLHDADLVIEKRTKTEADASDTAPDHLARLFAYNNIMRQVGSNYFKDDFINKALVDEAATAYVVSPVSSLIVLETKEDYERFGIKDKDNSLHNASKNSSGAVPEPHEWALIIVFLGFVAYYIVRYSRLKIIRVQK